MGGGLSSAEIFRTRGERGSSDADVRTFGAKNFGIFRNLWFVLADKGGLSQCRHFADKGEGSIFRDFVRTSFMDGPLLA